MVAIRHAYRLGGVPQPAPVDRLPPVPVERSEGERLLAEIEAFLRRNPRISRTRFGEEACANSVIIARLEGGLNPRPVTCERVRKYIRENGG